MLLNSFFEIVESSASADKLISVIRINAGHEIFKGHFPGNPVTPGVVQIQMVKEILANHYQKDLKLKTMSRCKLLRILNPGETPLLHITMDISFENDLMKVHASGHEKENVYFKLNAVYQ